jgi:hypothetical protein
LDHLLKIRDEGATACRGAPVFDNHQDSNEEYPSTTSWSRGGLKDEEATAHREAPVLDNHSQPDDYPESFSGNHPGLTITSTPQGRFVYWKSLEPSSYSNTISALWQNSPFGVSTLGSQKIWTTLLNFTSRHDIDVLQPRPQLLDLHCSHDYFENQLRQ